MRNPTLLEELARSAGAYTLERLPTIERIQRNSIATSSDIQYEARRSLVLQRTSSTYYKDPLKQKRNLMRSKKEKAALANTDNWTYNKAERYAVLDQQIHKGGAHELVQAILVNNLQDPLDVNVVYIFNSDGGAVCTEQPTGWLELAARRNGRNDVMYIRLLTNFGASQATKNKALEIALDSGSMETAQELLRNDADPNTLSVANHFLAAIKDRNQSLYTMFLRATIPLNQDYINKALLEVVGQDPDLVALLIAHGADGLSNQGEALCATIDMRALQDAAMILTSTYDDDVSINSLEWAINKACAIDEEKSKLEFLKLLFSAGANTNTPIIQDTLMEAVRKNHISLVEILVDYGTSPDRNGAESLRLAIVSGQTDIVSILLRGSISQTNTSRALEEASCLENIDTFEEIVKCLVEKGVSQPSLSKCLFDSVEKGLTQLAPMLIAKGAALDYGNAQSVRNALKRRDFNLFGSLLKGSCQPEVLCEVLSDAMEIQPSSERYHVLDQLLKKGVSGKGLHIALQTVARNPEDQEDYSLMELLMQHNASVDFFNENGNCLCTAAAQLNERALDLLCQGNFSPDTSSKAMRYLPVSFARAEAEEYEQHVGMMTTLLEKGACGNSVAKMLVKAVQEDHREKALASLIHHHADVNYKHGKAIEEALKLSGISALAMICKGCKIEKSSLEVQLRNSLQPKGFNLDKTNMLARYSKDNGHMDILNKALLLEVETNGSRREVVRMLLDLDASVDFKDARSLQHVTATGNIEICSILLKSGVRNSNIALAFPATSNVVDRPTRYKLMEALLEAAQTSIGQDQALVQESREAIKYDLSHVELLLKHHASADFDGGAAVLESIQTKNMLLLKRFISCGLNRKTLADALTLARKIKCTQAERYTMLETLLEVYNDVDQVSLALLEAVIHDPHDIKTSTLLLQHGASIELKNGLALQIVASSGSLELLKTFLHKNPSQPSRDAGFDLVTRSLLNNEQRSSLYQTLLKTSISEDLISAALLEATKAVVVDHSILALLIDFKASLDYDGGSTISGIVARGDIETLNILLCGKVIHKSTLDRSFTLSMGLSTSDRLGVAKALLEKDPGVSCHEISHHLAQIIREKDHNLLSLMMDYRADPTYNCGEGLMCSARAGDAKSTELLINGGLSGQIIDEAFEQLLNARTVQETPDGLQVMKILLSRGVSQHLVDRALLDGFVDAICPLTVSLVEILKSYHPNVSGGDGKIFVDAAYCKNVELFKNLASQNPDLNIVIPALIRSLEDEEELIAFLVYLEECSKCESELQGHVLFTAMRLFPEGGLLVKLLLDYGCYPNSKIEVLLEPSTEAESVTVLIWALTSVDPVISEAVILKILENGHDAAEVSFTSKVTHMSAILAASKTGRNKVLNRLIELGGDITHQDCDKNAALFYASRYGHKETVALLIQANAKNDDGSLHEAAREAHPEIIELLLENGHRPDYPSAIHSEGQFGRTALEELCLKTKSGATDWQKRIHQSIRQLLPSRLEDITQSGGKTMLHLALENEDSETITRELLSFPIIWENINDSIHLYQDGLGLVYSPTKYVELLFRQSEPDKCRRLITLLRANKCKDRLYAYTVEQPEGAIGLPADVAEAVNKQKRADHEQREDLKRRVEIAAQQRAIELENYERSLKLAKERHVLLMWQLKEQENAQKQMAQNTLRQEQELHREKQAAIVSENLIRLQGLSDEGAQSMANARNLHASELTYRQNLDQQEQAGLQAKLNFERQIISARETASQNEYNRQISLCNKKDASAKYQAQQRSQHPNV